MQLTTPIELERMEKTLKFKLNLNKGNYNFCSKVEGIQKMKDDKEITRKN